MSHWRNVLCDPDQLDSEMKRLDAMQAALGDLPADAAAIRALISRFDSITHYKCEDNVRFLLDAIGAGTYPGCPAVDVLWRAWECEDDRRRRFRGYVHALRAWAEDVDAPPDAVTQHEEVSVALGEPDQHKRWLALSLAKTLDVFTYSPEDAAEELPPKDFVRRVYMTALGRNPSPDDLRNRLNELASGKSGEDLLREVLASKESCARQMVRLMNKREDEGTP